MIKIGSSLSNRLGQKVVIYGPEGVGKTSLASQFPNPVFIDTEGSTKNYQVNRIEEGRAPSSWTELMNWVNFIKQNPETCKTLVIDTIDWAERLCNIHVCSQHNKTGIEDFGYGNGYTYSSEELGRFLDRLSDLVEIGINVVLTAHAQIRSFTQPDEVGTYDRYELKLGQKTSSRTSPLVKEWADMVLFINYKTIIVEDSKSKKGKGHGGERMMYTTHTPAWDAKNRHGLPPELPLSYDSIKHIFDIDDLAIQPEEVPVTQVTNEVIDIKDTVHTPENNDYSGLPKGLIDLMMAENVTKEEIQQACGPVALGGKGYFPDGMPVEEYDPSFIDGVLIAAWPQVFTLIQENRKLPF